jgi:hypothetical protein
VNLARLAPTFHSVSLTFLLAGIFPAGFELQFKSEINHGLWILDDRQKEICEASSRFCQDPREVIAMVFPEIVRYNYLQDFFETKSLELIYVNLGSREADFSIGYFQMKASFVERLEKNIVRFRSYFPELAFIAKYESLNENEIRRQRIDRMKTFEWQLNYAFAFYILASACFDEEHFESQSAQVGFLATAYNLGFSAKVPQIRAWTKIKAFPFGKKFRGDQWSYAELSSAFYENWQPAWTCEGFFNN